MIILPAIDIYDGKVVRLYQGDYDQMTVYDRDPVHTARQFNEAGAEWIHVVDLEGAKNGGTPNIDVIKGIVKETGMNVEIGGGIRNMNAIEKYIEIGAARVILGTAAITNQELVVQAAREFGVKVAVGADIKDGFVAIRGWTEQSDYTLEEFCKNMLSKGVKTFICTDVSKDGAMKGTNREMYHTLQEKFATQGIQVIASGGVSDMSDINALKASGVYGAIIGKAYYEGAIDLAEAIAVARA